jgi:hypothetical protein
MSSIFKSISIFLKYLLGVLGILQGLALLWDLNSGS